MSLSGASVRSITTRRAHAGRGAHRVCPSDRSPPCAPFRISHARLQAGGALRADSRGGKPCQPPSGVAAGICGESHGIKSGRADHHWRARYAVRPLQCHCLRAGQTGAIVYHTTRSEAYAVIQSPEAPYIRSHPSNPALPLPGEKPLFPPICGAFVPCRISLSGSGASLVSVSGLIRLKNS